MWSNVLLVWCSHTERRKNMDAKITMKAARVNAGYTQEAMAKLLDVTRVTYIKWENGKVQIRTPQFRMFCDIVGIGPDGIFLPKKST